jgi:hypothetical protein
MRITEVASDTKVVVSKSNRNRIIDERIKPPHMNRCFTCVVSGRPNSGKSMLVTHWLKTPPKKGGYKKCFDSVIMVMPPQSRKALDGGKVMANLDPAKVFDELDEDTCDEIQGIIETTKEEGDEEDEDAFSLLILDDVQSALRNKDVEKCLRNWLANYRHLNLCVVVCVQSYIALSKPCRDLFRCLIQFQTPNKKELARLHEEWCGSMSSDEFRSLFKYVFDKRYNFVFIDRQEQTFCKNFNRLKLESDNDD